MGLALQHCSLSFSGCFMHSGLKGTCGSGNMFPALQAALHLQTLEAPFKPLKPPSAYPLKGSLRKDLRRNLGLTEGLRGQIKEFKRWQKGRLSAFSVF